MRTNLSYFIWIVAILIQFGGQSTATNDVESPKSIAPQECCRFPQIFKQNLLDHCTYTTQNKGSQCFYECLHFNTELRFRRQSDYRKAENYIDWVMPGDHAFKNVYKRAYKECMDEALQLDKKDNQPQQQECSSQPEQVELCVQNKMFSLCPTEYFNSNKTECSQNRELDSLNTATNAAEPSKSIAPQECCRFPQIFKQNLLDHCTYTTQNKGSQCFYECLHFNTELRFRRQSDYRKAENYIDWVMPGDHAFKNVYKRAYKECMDEALQLDKKDNQPQQHECSSQPEQVELCVQNKMFSLCPTEYFSSNKTECIQERDLLKSQ